MRGRHVQEHLNANHLQAQTQQYSYIQGDTIYYNVVIATTENKTLIAIVPPPTSTCSASVACL